MNLNAIVTPYISAINPSETVTISPSAGYTTNADGSRVPLYGPPVTLRAQVQAMSFTDLQQVQGLNITGIKSAMYLSGDWNGVVRASQEGGDLITRADGTRWLINLVLEDWQGQAGWIKCIVTQQLP